MLRLLVAVTAVAHVAVVAGLSGTRLPDSPLRALQVQQPLPVPSGVKPCTVRLLQHVFANSYGQPGLAMYTPPEGCGKPGSWATVIVNFTATANGTQYDRLASLYLENTEILRTSTPEPTPKGIIWTALKDITRYSALLTKPGTLVLDLGNLLDPSSGLNGAYDVTLTASFYPSSAHFSRSPVADVILPIAANVTNQASNFHVPPAAQALLTLPRNGAKAFVEVYASGDSDEEYWYGDVPDQYFTQLPRWNGIDGYAVGKGPFREVQLLIDQRLAGVVFPYPVVYSGEFLPSLWRPMMSYGAFDSPTYYVDVTPFLPSLSDGKSHNFTLNVIGQGVNRSINSDWIVSGNVQIFLDSSDKPTTGRIVRYDVAPYPTPRVEGSVTGPAPNVSVTTTVARQLSIEADIITGSGLRTSIVWSQDLVFKNTEVYTVTPRNISTQSVSQTSSGTTQSLHNEQSILHDAFTFPLSLRLTYNQSSDGSLYDYDVSLRHSYDRAFSVPGVIERNIKTIQNAEGSQYVHTKGVRIRDGQTTELFTYTDAADNTFSRNVGTTTVQNTTTTTVVVASLLFDKQSGSLLGKGLSA